MNNTIFFFFLFLLLFYCSQAKVTIFVVNSGGSTGGSVRRVLHQPLFPVEPSPQVVPAAPSPPQDPTSNWPFFQPGTPGATTTPTTQTAVPPPPPPSVASTSDVKSPRPRSDDGGGKLKPLLVAAGSIAALLVLACLVVFFVFSRRRRSEEVEKVVVRAEPTATTTSSSAAAVGRREYASVASRSVAPMSEIYRPSPELQPMSPLNKAPIRRTPIPAIFSDEETVSYYSPPNTSVTLASPDNNNNAAGNNGSAPASAAGGNHRRSSSAHSCRTSPRSRLSASSGDGKAVQSPSHHLPSPAPPPGAVVEEPLLVINGSELVPPPPPPPPPAIPRPPKPVAKTSSAPSAAQKVTMNAYSEEEASSRGTEEEEGKPKLKPLHWDKVRATSDKATAWDQLRSSSFQLNENMIETLFVSNGTAQKEGRTSLVHSLKREENVLDPKKSHNIAILLKALNVNQEEVFEALLNGNHGRLSVELLENLVKMAPTKEEEIRLVNHGGDATKLGSAACFLKSLLTIPFAFKRIDAMVYQANFEPEVKYLKQIFETLEAACEELKASRLFLKLLEAVLRTGNKMNVGTFRGEATAFKLDTLLKLVDVKGADGKTTLLHFVVQEITRPEALGSEDPELGLAKANLKLKEKEFRKQRLQMVAGLSRDLGNVKKAAGMDSGVIHSYVHKLELGISKIKEILSCERSSSEEKFFESMKVFFNEADNAIQLLKAEEHKALIHVKEVTEYFHGDTAKEEAHPFRIFIVVKDFLGVLDRVCKEVETLEGRTILGAASSFRIPKNTSLPGSN